MQKAMDEKLRRRLEEDSLGKDIIDECRAQLMLKFRFLDLALWRMELAPLRSGARYPLATNGSGIAYDPPRVVARYRQDFNESIRDYLHMTLHCLFKHPYDRDHDDFEAWSLTCDVMAESVAMDLCARRFPSADDAERRGQLDTIRMMVGDLLPSKVYELVHNLVECPDGRAYRGLRREVLADWHALFERDEHAAWPSMNSQGSPSDEGLSSSGTSQDDEDPDDPPSGLEASGDDPQPSVEGLDDGRDLSGDEHEQEGDDSSAGSLEEAAGTDGEQEASGAEQAQADDPLTNFKQSAQAEQDERDWEDVSKQIEMELSAFGNEWGDGTSSFIGILALANRKRYDYSEFLRSFAVQSEEILVNPEEFDYAFYSYGMELYGKTPLIEPLEYKETDRVRDFVIAIDTSESVKGELVRRFIEHTFDILKESSEFASRVNIHVIQADNRIQQEMVIKDLKDVDAFMERLQIRGFGGTDFRPVFDHVGAMVEDGRLADLKGLVYFTDGLGTFPESAPRFDAAFVFLNDESRDVPSVPPWATKLIIDETSLKGRA
ncbi:hypothetical protein GMI69_00525 [Eggerthellaceae bacterium zg-887]|uniref:VWA-like domain-containing protein n=1 Tax=Xiamenia xianingshaonis TaxID=2682776 RepID=UPI00140E11AB|nr:VWA-like domain-containing protein [Xiamenia xianingshaonis]NHM15160.1 hypothetical protein [Xiamenia xianingshaonis]